MTNVEVKISLYGDSETGKTSLIQKYVTGVYQLNYIASMGVGFSNKEIPIQEQKVMLKIWDIGGDEEFKSMIPLSAEGSHAVVFVFDLTQKKSLAGIKQWFKTVHNLNNQAFVLLVGTKYDVFEKQTQEERTEVINMARKYAHAMGDVPLIFTSAAQGVNVNRLFKYIVALVFGLKSNAAKVSEVDKPIFEFKEE